MVPRHPRLRAAVDDLKDRMQEAFDRELFDLAMHRVRKRVKPANWEAFRLTAIEDRRGGRGRAGTGDDGDACLHRQVSVATNARGGGDSNPSAGFVFKWFIRQVCLIPRDGRDPRPSPWPVPPPSPPDELVAMLVPVRRRGGDRLARHGDGCRKRRLEILLVDLPHQSQAVGGLRRRLVVAVSVAGL